jgi:hypothetical protein
MGMSDTLTSDLNESLTDSLKSTSSPCSGQASVMFLFVLIVDRQEQETQENCLLS